MIARLNPGRLDLGRGDTIILGTTDPEPPDVEVDLVVPGRGSDEGEVASSSRGSGAETSIVICPADSFVVDWRISR